MIESLQFTFSLLLILIFREKFRIRNINNNPMRQEHDFNLLLKYLKYSYIKLTTGKKGNMSGGETNAFLRFIVEPQCFNINKLFLLN